MAKNTPDWISYNYSDLGRRRKKLFTKLALLFAAAAFLAGVSYALFFLVKLRSLEKKINPSSSSAPTLFETARSLSIESGIGLKGMEKGRINILLLGIAGEKKSGQNLTDTIMIASVNTETNKIGLFSVPRDLYVKISGTDLQGKINTIYQYGISAYKDKAKAADLVAQTVKNITGQDIDYYVVLNFDGFEKIIDSIGGVNIMNERDIYDARYPGPNYSYETFELKKGFHQLDGTTALKYVRERHNDPEGDFGRAKRQQQVLQSIKNKIFSAGTMLNVVAMNGMFNALGEAVQTNIAPEEIGSFLALSKKLDTQNINNLVLDAWNKESLLKVAHVQYGDVRAFVLIPRVGNYSEIQEAAQNIFDLNEIKRKRESVESENATISLLNQSGDLSLPYKIKRLLSENLNYKNISILSAGNRTLTEKTLVYDRTYGEKPWALGELVEKLPATLADGTVFVPAGNADMLVVLGKDLVDIYNVEEGTIDDLNKANDIQENLEYNKD
jgi:LCP family protein required for cell wall assembly